MSLLKTGFAVAFTAISIAACGSGQGDDCTTDSDCHSNLTCQTIVGRTKDYCCPTPAESSDFATCKPDLSASGSSSSSSSGAAKDAATE